MNSARLHFLIDVGVGRHVVANIMDHHSRRLQSHFSVFQRGKLRIRGK